MARASKPTKDKSRDDKLPYKDARVAEFTAGLGDRIRQVRRGIDLTQDEFGVRLGVTRQSVNGYEKARLLPPTQMIVKIADLTGHNPGWLLFGIGHPTQAGTDTQEAEGGPWGGLSGLTETQRYLINYIREDEKAAEKMAQLLWKKALEI